MKIALLGGAFNPPHLGHMIVARQVLDFTDTDEVWFTPNYHQNFPKPIIDAAYRLAMTRMLVIPKTQVSTLEIDHQLDGQTIHLLPYLPKKHSYTFIIGSDQLAQFHLWGQWEKLLEAIPFWVFPRYGYPSEPLYNNMKLISHQLLIASNISATKVRERVKLELPIAEFVPAGVAEYIKQNKLYQ